MMHMFSEELSILDKNTVMMMIEEQKQELSQQKQEIERLRRELEEARQKK